MKLPEHLFVSSTDGGLYDTRVPHWSSHPLRANYRRTFQIIRTPAEFKATLRNGAYAWPGGYPLFLLCDDSSELCFDCARSEARQIIDAVASKRSDGWRVIGCDVNWEDSDTYCAHCNERIKSAYGDDNE